MVLLDQQQEVSNYSALDCSRGVAAVAATFFITISPRLMVARDIIGGIYFPLGFFLRIALALVVEAGALFWVTRQLRVFERFSNEWLNIGLLFGVGLAYITLFLLSVRILRLVRQSDIADFQSVGIPSLNKLLGRLFGV